MSYLSLAVPSATGIDGLLAPSPAAHALLLAAHAWAHHPLGRVGDLIDVAAILPRDERPRGLRRSRSDGAGSGCGGPRCRPLTRILGGAPEPLALRTWARHLGTVSELVGARRTT